MVMWIGASNSDTSLSFTVNEDCRHFRGDRPCVPHKREGIHCLHCSYYDPITFRILVVKLDAVGDVLRTTCILPGLKSRHANSQITWITKPEAIPLFENNKYVDRVYDVAQAVTVLSTDLFDLVINLDASLQSSRIAAMAKCRTKVGYSYDQRGFVYPVNPDAEEWFVMGIFDDYKRQNVKTYQHIALEICGLPIEADEGLILNLDEEESRVAEEFARRNFLLNGGPVIGLNTGAGRRWAQKKWTVEGYISLASLLKGELPDCKIILYGGPEERERNHAIEQAMPSVVNAGTGHSLRDFAAIVSLADLLVTGDTLAMHIAVALGIKVVALFGPTSSAEIELYGRGKKLTAPLSCLCCYRGSCEIQPNCMESITPESVLEAVLTSLTDSRAL